ncbi:hypothetical protein JCM10908_006248 [Rhodotorula pacifica]|uniref:uncharacterized protein n=1 Tax=Rhodotorula pacifica TaxID=1495444 RepID=UPI00316D60B0
MSCASSIERRPTSLLSLPDELLERIFHHIETPSKRFLANLSTTCRRLEPIAGRLLNRTCKLTCLSKYGVEKLERRTPRHDRPILHLSVNTFDGVEEAYAQDVIARYLSQIRELEVVIGRPNELLHFLALLPPSKLRILHIEKLCPDEDREEEGLDKLFRGLQAFPNLQELQVDDSELKSRHTGSNSRTVAIPRLPQLRKLSVDDRFCRTAFPNRRHGLSRIMPNLEVLILRFQLKWMSSNGHNWTPLLATLPATLRHLSICTRWHRDESPTPSGYLAKLPNLRYLRLGPTTFLEEDLLAYLPSSQLEMVVFDSATPVSDKVLHALTEPSIRPARLRLLRLRYIGGPLPHDIRHSFDSKHHILLYPEETETRLREWLRPQWPPGATDEGFCEAVGEAMRSGISVEGYTLACYKWQGLFEKELWQCLMKASRAKDDFTYVVSKYGREAVIGWLWSHAPNAASLLGAVKGDERTV